MAEREEDKTEDDISDDSNDSANKDMKESIEDIIEDIEEREMGEDVGKDLNEAEEAEELAKRMEEEGDREAEIQETLEKVADEGSEDAEGAEDTEDTEDERDTEFLVSRQRYLASGIHIGMKQRTKQMRQFIYKVRPDGLAVMNLRMIDQRIRIAAKFLSNAKNIVVVSRRSIAHKAIGKFAELVGAKTVEGRFMPGTLTNPNYEEFYEADVVFVVDPMSDYQAVKEAITARIPILAICDTFNETNSIDLVIPANNKGAKAIATLFWLLAREILKERGKIKSDDDYKAKVTDFMKEMERRDYEAGGEERPRRRGVRGRMSRSRGRGRDQSLKGSRTPSRGTSRRR